MGIVFLAEDRRTHLPVAAKVMSRSLADPELQARFMKENQILASLNHRNIVRCYEITRSREGLPTIVMESGSDEVKGWLESLGYRLESVAGSSNVIYRHPSR